MGSSWSTPEVKYCVVKPSPSYNIDEYVIVPRSWIWQHTNEDVAISYPKEDLKKTLTRVENNENCSKNWNIYRVSVISGSDSYQKALQGLLVLKKKSEQKPPPVGSPAHDKKIEEPTTSGPPKSERTEKEKSEEDADETYTSPKRDLKNPFKKTDDSSFADSKDTLRYPNFVELVPKSNVFVKAEKLEECKNSSDNRNQLSIALMTAIFTDEILAKLLLTSHDGAHTASSPRPVLNKRETKAVLEFVTKIKGKKWEKCALINLKQDGPNQTLIHPNLVRLIPSGKPVLVNEKELEECKASSNGVRNELVRGLMKAVFTEKALSCCSLFGQDAVAFDRSESDTRSGLDEHAVEVILKYVENVKDDDKNEWDVWNGKSVKKAMYKELEKLRIKSA